MPIERSEEKLLSNDKKNEILFLQEFKKIVRKIFKLFSEKWDKIFLRWNAFCFFKIFHPNINRFL